MRNKLIGKHVYGINFMPLYKYFRKYSNVKRWEANLRAYQGLASAQTSRRQKTNAQRYEDNDWTDGAAAEAENPKLMARPMPPPPSPTVKSLATLPH